MSDASISFECKPPSPFSSRPNEEDLHELVTISDLASVSLAHRDHPNEVPNEVPDELVQNMVTSLNGMQDDADGGGMRVKKKRKKKEPGQQELGGETEAKPKRKREPKEPKESKKPKEPKQEPKQEGAKKPRKPREPKVPKEPKEKKSHSESPPKTKLKKARLVLLRALSHLGLLVCQPPLSLVEL